MQRIDQRAIAKIRSAVLLHLRKSAEQGLRERLTIVKLLPGRGKEDRYQHPARSAHHRSQPLANQQQQLRHVIKRERVLLQALRNIPRPLRKSRAGIAISHPGIQRVQAVFQLDQRCRHGGDKRTHLRIVRGGILHTVMNGAMRHGTQWRKRDGLLPAQRLDVGVNRLFEEIVELQQRQRKAFHIQRADQRRRANQVRDTLFQRRMRQLFGQQRHLQRRYAAKIVNQHRKTPLTRLRA